MFEPKVILRKVKSAVARSRDLAFLSDASSGPFVDILNKNKHILRVRKSTGITENLNNWCRLIIEYALTDSPPSKSPFCFETYTFKFRNLYGVFGACVE